MTQIEKKRWRLTTWTYDVEWMDKYNISQLAEWDGLKAVGRVQTTHLLSGKETQEIRFYLLSSANVNLFRRS